MRTAAVTLAAVLLASTAHADIITAGTWKGAPPPCECGDTPYSNSSLDGPELNAGYVVAQLLGLPTLTGVEYLHAPFTIEDAGAVTQLYTRTGYPSVMSLLADGRVQLLDGRGNAYYSSGAGSERFTAFRLPAVTTALGTSQRVLWCGEDLDFPWLSLERGHPTYTEFGDCNDQIQETTFFTPILTPTPGCVNCEPPSVGEPGTLALMGMVALGVARRMRGRA